VQKTISLIKDLILVFLHGLSDDIILRWRQGTTTYPLSPFKDYIIC
jgi:hypothetical protein